MAFAPGKDSTSVSGGAELHRLSGTTAYFPQQHSNTDYEDQADLFLESPDFHHERGYFSDNDSPSPPDPGIDLIRFTSIPSSIVEGRRSASELLSLCRTILTTLELTRMRKARIGLQYWTGFWYRIYKASLADAICRCVLEVYPKMDKLFKATAENIINIIANIDKRVAGARSEKEIAALLRQLELQIKRCVKLRQINAQIIFETMRFNLEKIPVDVADAMFDDLKRGVFALDGAGDYHPGDAMAEEKDKHIGKPLSGLNYISQQPDLVLRPGFTGEFQEALVDATMTTDEGYVSADSTQSMEVEGYSSDSEIMVDWQSSESMSLV